MTIRVFASGQSNVLGRGTGGRSLSLVSSSVRVWNAVNPSGSNGTGFVTASAAQAAGTFEHTDTSNLVVWMCDRIARVDGVPVDMTIVGRGATPIAYWSPEQVTENQLQRCIDVWAATGQAPADVFVWHQGEGDVVAADFAGWIAAFDALVANLIAAGVISATAKIILGGVTCSSDVKLAFNRQAILPSCIAPGRVYASSYGLENDGTHFTGAALQAFGVRYYSAYKAAQEAA